MSHLQCILSVYLKYAIVLKVTKNNIKSFQLCFIDFHIKFAQFTNKNRCQTCMFALGSENQTGFFGSCIASITVSCCIWKLVNNSVDNG